jgi:tetratricopeptide (TPR) repeat protein
VAQENFGHLLKTFERRREQSQQLEMNEPADLYVRRMQARDLLESLRELPESLGREAEARYLLAEALTEDANTAFGLNQADEGLASSTAAEEMFRALVSEDPDRPEYRAGLGWTLAIRGRELAEGKDPAAADLLFGEAFDQLRTVCRRWPGCRLGRDRLVDLIGIIHRLEDQASPVFRCETMDEALPLAEGLAAEWPDNPRYQWRVVYLLGESARLHFRAGRNDEALAGFRTTVERIAVVRQRLGVVPRYLFAEGYMYALYGRTQERLNLPEAEQSYKTGLQLLRDYVRRYPSALQARFRAGETAHMMGLFLGRQPRRRADAVAALQLGRGYIGQVFHLEPSNPQYAKAFLTWNLDLGNHLLAARQWAEAANLAVLLNQYRHWDAEGCVGLARFSCLCAAMTANNPVVRPVDRPTRVRAHHLDALGSLTRAADLGYRNWSKVQTDPAFGALAETPELKALVARGPAAK